MALYERQKRHSMGISGKIIARKLHLEGIVQGVGFRPLVFRLAKKYALTGWVLNSSRGLEIWVEGREAEVQNFCDEIFRDPPRLARVLNQVITNEAVQGHPEFVIRHSQAMDGKLVLISPDVATCADCYSEIRDPKDRRYAYPFTNCTNCGPRYTIIQDVPYDRRNTTMQKFPMCPQCQAEYDDPSNRRFHAQPNACPICGPALQLLDREGRDLTLAISLGEALPDYQIGLQEARRLLKNGSILAVKGLGGFHLACDAQNAEAVRQLRQRKRRDYKPFALMARDLAVARKYCRISVDEERWLLDPASPIVIADIRDLAFAQADLPLEFLAPGLNTLGIMLPYTPLHQLLFEDDLELLVMTSANLSDDPLVTENQEALVRLRDIADYFLVHNRDIFNRCDDSLVRRAGGRNQFYRRARGFVPFPVPLAEDGPVVLGVGGELKNTFALTRKKEAYLSQHLGDLNHWGNYQQFLEAIPRLEKMLEVQAAAVAYDLHPDYASTRYARGRQDLVQVGIQHHHAHLASCMAENQTQDPALGVICDGTGYGTDGTIWGFEFLYGDCRGFARLGNLRPLPLPGGEASIRRPGRMALANLWQLLGEATAREWAGQLPLGLSPEEIEILFRQLARGINTFETSSCGRLFDAVAGFLGVCPQVGYEGQAAVELETLAGQALGLAEAVAREDRFADVPAYPFSLLNLADRETVSALNVPVLNAPVWETPRITWPKPSEAVGEPTLIEPDSGRLEARVNPSSEVGPAIYGSVSGGSKLRNGLGPYWLDPTPMWRELLADYQRGESQSLMALRFHLGLTEGITQACQKLQAEIGFKQVVLSGGVFHNRILLTGLLKKLSACGLSVLTHQLVPPGDGGISLGQAAIARAVLRNVKP